MVRKAMSVSSFLVFPLMMGMAICAEPIVSLILTDKWLPCVPYLQILCLSYMLWPIHTANLQAINALGRSDIYLKLEVIKKIIGIISLLISLPFGVIVMVYMKLVTGIISTFVNSYPNKKLLDYSYIHQIIDLLPALLLSIIMSIVVLGIDSFLSYNSFSLTIRLVIDIVTGLFVYLIMAVITKNNHRADPRP